MEKIAINSTFKLPTHRLTISEMESKTVKHNYVPVRIQIENMYAAGARLDAVNKGIFDYNADPDTGYFNFNNKMLDVTDPTRQRSFDLTDYAELERGTHARLYNQTIQTLQSIQRQKNDTQEKKVSMGDTIIKDNVSPPQGPPTGDKI